MLRQAWTLSHPRSTNISLLSLVPWPARRPRTPSRPTVRKRPRSASLPRMPRLLLRPSKRLPLRRRQPLHFSSRSQSPLPTLSSPPLPLLMPPPLLLLRLWLRQRPLPSREGYGYLWLDEESHGDGEEREQYYILGSGYADGCHVPLGGEPGEGAGMLCCCCDHS